MKQQVIEQVFDDAPDVIAVPMAMRGRRIRVIFSGLEGAIDGKDANGWPLGFFEQTAGSIPDLPDREPQGEYEEREPFE